VLLAHDLLAYDELRTGRLVIPVARAVSTGRGYCFVCPKSRSERPQVQAFRTWVKQELAAIDWRVTGTRNNSRGAMRIPRPPTA
jgi:LysR family glycine cleavage system transcriptional activator